MDALHLVWGRPSVAADWLLTQQLAFLLADTCQGQDNGDTGDGWSLMAITASISASPAARLARTQDTCSHSDLLHEQHEQVAGYKQSPAHLVDPWVISNP